MRHHVVNAFSCSLKKFFVLSCNFSINMRQLKKYIIKSRSIKALMELMIAILNIYFYAREKYELFLTHFINLEMRIKS